MTRKHGPWVIKETTRKYRHKLIEVYEHQIIRPDGSDGIYATIKVNPGVSVLALDKDGAAYLAREFRFAIGANSLEVVSGAIDDGEQPIDSARRELKEELGIEAGDWTELGRVDPITSIIDSPSSLFLATDLTFKEKKNKGSERIEAVKVSLREAARMVIDGEITHGASGVLILRALAHMNRK